MKKWLVFLFLCSAVQADIISDLQREIIQDYIPQLEDRFGYCGDKSCIEFQDGQYRLKLPQKEVCLPWTACSFYRCMEEKYQCEGQGVNYFTKLAEPTCKKYVENIGIDYYSQEAKEWIYTVMVCLQKGLITECEINGNCEISSPRTPKNSKVFCPYIVDFTLDYHPGCYINSGVGVCNLSFQDKWRIWNTVSPFMTKDERKQAWRVVWYCLFPNKSKMLRGF